MTQRGVVRLAQAAILLALAILIAAYVAGLLGPKWSDTFPRR